MTITLLAAMAVAVAVYFATRESSADSVSPAEVIEFGATEEQGATASSPNTDDQRSSLRHALEAGVADADRLGGVTAAAVWERSWQAPIAAGAIERRWRMWSTSKPVVGLTLLRLLEREDEQPSPALKLAIRDAIQRSENCRQRRVVLTLQNSLGGRPAAEEALEQTLSQAGSTTAKLSRQHIEPDPKCVDYVSTAPEIKDPSGDALPMGVATWTASDAVAFVHHLAASPNEPANAQMLSYMRLPKRRSRELQVQTDYSARTDWGAGRVFKGMDPAYKAGWGGTRQGNFIVSQIVDVETEAGQYAIAVEYAPDAQPGLDDPGRTVGPEAVEAVLRSVRRSIQGFSKSGSRSDVSSSD